MHALTVSRQLVKPRVDGGIWKGVIYGCSIGALIWAGLIWLLLRWWGVL